MKNFKTVKRPVVDTKPNGLSEWPEIGYSATRHGGVL